MTIESLSRLSSDLSSLSHTPSHLDHLTDEQRQRLTQVLDEHLVGLESGEPLDRKLLRSQHLDLAEILDEYLDQLDSLYQMAAGFQSTEGPIAYVDPEHPLTLGDYRINREIGRGGMGIVYEATQISLNRRVAIKLLPMSAIFDQKQITRFRNESNAAGHLQHPHIVPVYAVGLHRGIHYYAMQFIDGVSLDVWIERQRKVILQSDLCNSDSEQQKTSWRDSVRWIHDASEALQCAHESNIVHRDIKPSNLMIDSQNQVWVTDFGLARFPSNQTLTRNGDLIGTMRYMSPEQACGRTELVDHRSDIYSLGATLYELLTLQPVIVGDGGPAILKAIESSEPPKLKRLCPNVPIELETVLQKAMAKQRDERFVTAQAFADDLLAVLEGRATVAQPPKLKARISRWANRHRRLVATASLASLVIGIAMTVTTLIIAQKNRIAVESYQRADRYFRQAKATVDHFGSDVAEQLAAVPGAERIRQSILQETLGYYRDFVVSARDDSSLQSDLALTHNRIGSLLEELESPQSALVYYQTSNQIYEQLVESASSDSTYKQAMAQNLNHLALAETQLLKFDDAEKHLQKAIDLQESLQQESLQTDSIDSHAANLEDIQTELALSKNNLGLLFRETDRTNEAKNLFDSAITQLTSITRVHSENAIASRGLIAALSNLAVLETAQEPRKAIVNLEKAIDQQLANHGNMFNRMRGSFDLATAHSNLGSAYRMDDQYDRGAEQFNVSIRIFRQLIAMAPDVDRYRRELATSLNNLGMCQQDRGRHRDAIKNFQEAIDLQIADSDQHPRAIELRSRLGAMKNNLGLSYLAVGEIRDAENAMELAIEYQTAVYQEAKSIEKFKLLLMNHYSNYLKVLDQLQLWEKLVSAMERQRSLCDNLASNSPGNSSANFSGTLMQLAKDYAEIANRLKDEVGRRKLVTEVAKTISQARDTGYDLHLDELDREPFLPLDLASVMRSFSKP